MEFPWEEDAEMRAALDTSYPFRPVKATAVERYGLFEAPDS
jgi:hypothetical protein